MKVLSVSPWKRAYTPDTPGAQCPSTHGYGGSAAGRITTRRLRGHGDEARSLAGIVVSGCYCARCAVSGWLPALLKNAASSAVASSNCSSWS